jgi:hypothetical protein
MTKPSKEKGWRGWVHDWLADAPVTKPGRRVIASTLTEVSMTFEIKDR